MRLTATSIAASMHLLSDSCTLQYGGTGGEGIGVFLRDGSEVSRALGSTAASALGYLPCSAGAPGCPATQPGLQGGLIGIGFLKYGEKLGVKPACGFAACSIPIQVLLVSAAVSSLIGLVGWRCLAARRGENCSRFLTLLLPGNLQLHSLILRVAPASWLHHERLISLR